LLVKKVLVPLVALGLCAAFAPALHAQTSTGVDFEILTAAAGGGCAAGTAEPQPLENGEGFTIPGEFLEVQPVDLCRSFDVPLAYGVAYRRIEVEFDLALDHWVSPFFSNITSLRRSGKKRNERVLYYGLILRGDKRRTVLDRGNDALTKVDGPWQEHNSYHITLSADLNARKINLNVYQGDQLVHTVSGKMTAREIKSFTDKVVRVDFSSPGVGDGAYFPPAGSRYSNLTVTAFRR
jgi:hypothetical protein